MINQKDFVRKQPPPVAVEDRQFKSTHAPIASKPVDIPKCMKKLDEEIFKGSTGYQTIFHQFDKDKDGFISEADFVTTLAQANLLSEEESKQVFDHIGGNKGKCEKCLTFEEFTEKIKPGMGTQSADQYPNFLRSRRLNDFRGTERMTKSDYFDPKSLINVGIFVSI